MRPQIAPENERRPITSFSPVRVPWSSYAHVLCRVQLCRCTVLRLSKLSATRMWHYAPSYASCLTPTPPPASRENDVATLLVVFHRSGSDPATSFMRYSNTYLYLSLLTCALGLVNVLERGATFAHPLVHKPGFQPLLIIKTVYHLFTAWRAELVCFPVRQQAPFSAPRVVQGFRMSVPSPAVCKRIS
jgi:hypothetical protein